MLTLIELRTESGLSMRQVSTQLEIPYNTYAAYEKGTKEPDISTLIKMADFFNCSVDRLLGRISRKKNNKSLQPKQYENTHVFPVKSVQIKQVIDGVPQLTGAGSEPQRSLYTSSSHCLKCFSCVNRELLAIRKITTPSR